MYFKRELIHKHERLFPISFSIPTTKINFNTQKIKDFSFITPLDRKTYIYNNERDYYNDYNEARFGVTLKKAGWDCMRHYEILANGCLPYFVNISACPQNTMTSFPKQLCSDLKKEIDEKINPEVIYERYVNKFKEHFFENNTTKAGAINFINTIKTHSS